MNPEPPGASATVQDLARYLYDKHLCDDKNHAETNSNFRKARRWSWATLIALGGLIAAVVTMAGTVLFQSYRVVVWTDGVNARLDALSVAGLYRDQRLDSLDTSVQALWTVARGNQIDLHGRLARAKHR